MRTLEERLDTEIQCDSMVTQRIFALLRDHCYCAMYRTFTGNLSHEEAVLFTLANIRVEGRAVFAVSTRCAVLLGDEAVTALQNYLVQLALVRRPSFRQYAATLRPARDAVSYYQCSARAEGLA